MVKREPSCTVGGIQPLWKTLWRFLKKLKIELPYDPAIPLLGIYPENTIIQKESCITVFITALFTIARTWKQPKCPSTDEWIKKMWHTYTMEYYSAIKRNKIELFVVRWMDLESVIQSELSQKGGKWGCGSHCVMNWEIRIDIYTLICIKWIIKTCCIIQDNNIQKFKKQ